jgi:glycosyltransferase involved in cell wall biosynthesis
MSEKVMHDLRKFEKEKTAILLPHPLYDNFGDVVPKEIARQHLGLPEGEKIILFFGFIRKYKGLHLLLDAMADKRIKDAGIKLLVAGEFYGDDKPYHEQIRKLGIKDQLLLRTSFIPDSEVKNYFCAADVVIQPYRNATQSGVTPLAYHFETPMVVTNVGGLPSMVTHNQSGIITEPDPVAIATGIMQFFETGGDHFIPYIREKKKLFSWPVFVQQIFQLSDSIEK